MKATKNASPLYGRVSKAHHGCTKAVKIVHLRFMSLSKMCIAIDAGHMRLHVRLNCRGVALMSKLIGLAQYIKSIFPNGDFDQSYSKTAPPMMYPSHMAVLRRACP